MIGIPILPQISAAVYQAQILCVLQACVPRRARFTCRPSFMHPRRQHILAIFNASALTFEPTRAMCSSDILNNRIAA